MILLSMHLSYLLAFNRRRPANFHFLCLLLLLMLLLPHHEH